LQSKEPPHRSCLFGRHLFGFAFLPQNAHKLPQRQRISQPPRDPALTVDTLEVPESAESENRP
jgi:hypothetical protein